MILLEKTRPFSLDMPKRRLKSSVPWKWIAIDRVLEKFCVLLLHFQRWIKEKDELPLANDKSLASRDAMGIKFDLRSALLC